MVLDLLNNPLIILVEKTLIISESTLNGLKKMTKNVIGEDAFTTGYEPDNVITFYGIETEKSWLKCC